MPTTHLTLRYRFQHDILQMIMDKPQVVKRQRLYVSENGITANNLIAIAGMHVMKSWNYNKETATVSDRRSAVFDLAISTRKIARYVFLLGDRVIGGASTTCSDGFANAGDQEKIN